MIRGSTKPYSTSASRLPSRTIIPPIMTIASTTGKSFVVTLWTARNPRPGHEKIDSVIAARTDKGLARQLHPIIKRYHAAIREDGW